MSDKAPFSGVKSGAFTRLQTLGLNQGNIGGYLGDPYNYSGIPFPNGQMILARRDEILLQEGGGGPRAIERYMRLFFDSQVMSAWDKLVGEIVQRKWEVFPASQSAHDEEVAEFVRQVIYHIGSNTRQGHGNTLLVSTNSGFDNLIRGLAESLVTGLSIGEICWIRQGKYTVPSEIKIRDPRRFLFKMNGDGTVAPRLITISSPVEGMEIPLRSMIFHRHWTYSGFLDPYGAGLGRQLYSLVDFRRTLLSFWLSYTDKFTTPTAVGKYPMGTPKEEVDALFTALNQLGQETSIVAPAGVEIDYLTNSAGATSTDIYDKLISYVDQQISYLINGETTAGQETGNVGSYARDQISDSIRIRKAKTLSEELDETLNATLIRWIVELNYPGSAIPRIARNFEDITQKEDPVKTIQVLSQLQSMGYGVSDIDWLRDKLELPSLEKLPQPPPEAGGPPGAEEQGSQPFTENPRTEEEMVDQYNGSRGAPGGKFDFDVFSFAEDGEVSIREKVSTKIAKKFEGIKSGDVGFQRITKAEDAQSRLVIDEWTDPGDIIFSIKSLLDQVEQIPMVISNESAAMYDLKNRNLNFERSLAVQQDLTEEEIAQLLELYDLAYRLNRKVVFKECIVTNPKEMGYWAVFAPYYM